MSKKRKPSVYLDTTIFSALHYRGDILDGIHRQIKTSEWWESERKNFELYSSRFTEYELIRGVYRAKLAAIAEARRIKYLPATKGVYSFSLVLRNAKIVPHSKPNDAMQLAFATIHGVNYLLSWNYAHMANPEVQRSLDSICQRHGFETPLMVTPESIPQIRFGESPERQR